MVFNNDTSKKINGIRSVTICPTKNQGELLPRTPAAKGIHGGPPPHEEAVAGAWKTAGAGPSSEEYLADDGGDDDRPLAQEQSDPKCEGPSRLTIRAVSSSELLGRRLHLGGGTQPGTM